MTDQNNGWVDRSNSAPLNTQANGGVAPSWWATSRLIGTVWVRTDDSAIEPPVFTAPGNGYVIETGGTFYVAEDGTTFYVQEP